MQPNTLISAQRWALECAEAHDWSVQVEVATGARATLRQGQPARAVVLFLSDRARQADDRATRQECRADAA